MICQLAGLVDMAISKLSLPAEETRAWLIWINSPDLCFVH
jgi:hypothetical protein